MYSKAMRKIYAHWQAKTADETARPRKAGGFTDLCFLRFATDATADTVTVVKKLVCYFLMVVLAWVSGGASAHALNHTAHLADERSHQSQVAVDSTTVSVEQTATHTKYTKHAETCKQTHCSHGHLALPALQSTRSSVGCVSCAPVFLERWVSSAFTNNIERPNW